MASHYIILYTFRTRYKTLSLMDHELAWSNNTCSYHDTLWHHCLFFFGEKSQQQITTLAAVLSALCAIVNRLNCFRDTFLRTIDISILIITLLELVSYLVRVTPENSLNCIHIDIACMSYCHIYKYIYIWFLILYRKTCVIVYTYSY